MTSLFGNPGERWPLSSAVDAMVSSARRTGFPALLWLVGVIYPSLTLGLGLFNPILAVLEAGTDLELQAVGQSVTNFLAESRLTSSVISPTILTMLSPSFGASRGVALLLLLPVSLIVSRLAIGLAQLSETSHWNRMAGARRTPSLPSAWRAGKGLTLSALGLLLSFPLLLMAAVLFLLGPLILLLTLVEPVRQFPSFIAVLVVPVALSTLAYAVVLQVLVQLGLHSLARNRRGCASALTHAWRMVRNSPRGAARAMLVDLFLQVSLLAVLIALAFTESTAAQALGWTLLGFVGVTRASYWAETYEGLGGLSTSRESVVTGAVVRT